MQLSNLARRSLYFAQRQTHDFKLMLVRRALHGFATNLSVQYDSIYAVLLGADPLQLGSLQSVGNAFSTLAALPTGWFIDYYTLKAVFLLGTVILIGSRFLYLFVPDWTWLYVAIILYYFGARITCTSCTVTCAKELSNEDRATGRGFCQALSSPAAIIAPFLAGWLITRFGGLTIKGIRPLYALQALVFLGILLLLWVKFSPVRLHPEPQERRRILVDFIQVFRQGKGIVRTMILMGLMEVPWTLARPFMPLYAHEFKGANEYLLGAIGMASALVPMLASVPLGRLADRYGRKKLLFAIAPLTYIANLCLIYAPPSGSGASLSLMFHGVLFGFNSTSMALMSSMAAEVMPLKQMGRWIGAVTLFRGMLGVPAPMLGGFLWERIGPQYVFLAAIAIDAFVRLPLLAMTGETLNLPRR
jgi:MFS family permease